MYARIAAPLLMLSFLPPAGSSQASLALNGQIVDENREPMPPITVLPEKEAPRKGGLLAHICLAAWHGDALGMQLPLREQDY